MQRNIPLRLVAFAALAAIVSILFVRLGFWQLDRYDQVRATNEARAARVAFPPIPLASLVSGDVRPSGSLNWRRVTLVGRWNHDGSVLIRGRARHGRPGVHIVTPLELPGEAGPVLVLRGWMPAADGATPDIAPSRDDAGITPAERRVGVLRRSRTGAGSPMVVVGERGGDGATRMRSFAVIDVPAIAGDSVDALPYFVQLLPSDTEEDDVDLRSGESIPVALPEPDNGPHMSYAIQWFSFAVIALVGTGALFRRENRRRPADARYAASDTTRTDASR